MKKIICLPGILWLCVFLAPAQSYHWQWAKDGKGGGLGEGLCAAIDAAGNVYAGGFFTDTVTFGNITMVSHSVSDIFLVKYDSTGTPLWAKSAGREAVLNSVATDGLNNVYVTGWFMTDSIVFDAVTLYHTGAQGFADIFLACYDSDGNLIWAKKVGAAGADWAYAVSTDAGGHVYIAGLFQSDSLVFDTVVLNLQGQGAAFIAKYDATGNVLWAKKADGADGDGFYGMATDALGNSVVTGFLGSDIIQLDTITLHKNSHGPGDVDMLLIKYNNAGHALWATTVGSNSTDVGRNVALDKAGNVYVLGIFRSDSVTFGNTVLHNPSINMFDEEAFIAKYNAGGQLQWAKSVSGNISEEGWGITTDNWGNVYFTVGSSSDSVIFDGLVFKTPQVSIDQMFVFTINPDGNLLCGQALVAGGDDQVGLQADRQGNVYMAGDFFVDPFILGSDTLIRTSTDENIFVARFNCRSALPTGITEAEENTALQIYPNPVSGVTEVRYAMPVEYDKGELLIYDLAGRPISRFPLTDNKGLVKINAAHLSSGIYFYSLVAGGKMLATRKIVVE